MQPSSRIGKDVVGTKIALAIKNITDHRCATFSPELKKVIVVLKNNSDMGY